MTPRRRLSARRLTRRGARLAAAALIVSALGGCSDREQARLRDTTQPVYDPKTGRLRELTYDANRNGRIDTWTEMDGSRPLRSRIDRDEDGTPDRWEYYDESGQLTKVGFSRANDGKPDAWAFSGPAGAIERIEISSTGDERRIDRWERYAPPAASDQPAGMGPIAAAEEDTDGDGRPDKWETYDDGVLRAAAFDENRDGRPDRRLTYDRGTLKTIETAPDASGRFTKIVRIE